MDTEATLEQFDKICSTKIRDIIGKLPNESGTKERISNDILKYICKAISEEIIMIMNDSVKYGNFPEK